MKKLNLKELNVNSFVTAIDKKLADTAKGGNSNVRGCKSNICSHYWGCQPQTNVQGCTNFGCPSDEICPQPTKPPFC